MENLGINGGQILAQIVNFFVVFFLFKKFVYKKLINTFEEREVAIKNSLTKATEIDEKEAQILASHKKTEEKLTIEAHKLKQKMLKEAEQEAKEILHSAQKDAQNIKSSALSEAKDYLEHAHKKHDKELSEQAVALSKKALSKLLSDKSQKEIAEKKVRELLSS